MALSDIPPVKPPKGAIYYMGIFLATFVFWFTRPKASDEAATDQEDSATKSSQR